jgi:4-hydroxybenzoate polyprenyltransferase
MHSFLKLIRWSNLIIIALTMFVIRYGITEPILSVFDFKLELPVLYFSLIVLAVVLIAAAGYIINDYNDVETDTINKPSKVIVGKTISQNTAFNIYVILNSIAVAAALWVSWKFDLTNFFTIFPIAIGTLWFYSTTYKQQLLIGNIITAFLTALVPFTSVLYDLPLVIRNHKFLIQESNFNLNIIFAWVGAFAAFAFLLNLIREIVKDAEDYEGDNHAGYNTLPIVWGIKSTKAFVSILTSITIVGIAVLFALFLRTDFNGKFDSVSFFYILVLIIVPLIISNLIIFKPFAKRNYTIASALLKISMVSGILFALIVRYKLHQ